MSCIPLLNWSSPFSQNGRRSRQTDCILIKVTGPCKRKYSQLDKEGLAIIFGVKRFHQYLFGRHFTIVSDHKPLQHLFKESSATPTLASARIQRWALILGAYDYRIEYKPGTANGNADMLSCLPLPDTPSFIPVPGETVLLMDMLNSLPVTSAQIKQWTSHDPLFSRVRTMVLTGWRDSVDDNLKPYQQRQNILSVHDGCLALGKSGRCTACRSNQDITRAT